MDPSPPIGFDESRRFIADACSVLFFARRGERTLRCYLTWDALVTCLGVSAHAMRVDVDCLQAYDRHADAIHRLARRLIGDALPAGGGVVISAEDLQHEALLQGEGH